MTVTESKPEETVSSTELVEFDPAAVPLPPPPLDGLPGVISTFDHKTTGRLYIGFSLVFIIGGLILSALVDFERTTPDTLGTVLTVDTFFQVFTLSRVGIALLGVLPLLLGIATYIVPLQVGAPSSAFPRAGALGMWTWAIGADLFIAGYLINGGFAGGRFEGVELSLLALLMIIAGLCVSTVAVLTTAATMRADGMALSHIPPFSWSVLVGGFVWLVTLGVLAGNVAIIWADFHYGQVAFGDRNEQWSQVSWLLRQPGIYLFAIPALGFIAEVVPTMVGTRQRQYGVVMGSIGAFAVLSFGGWAQTAFDASITQEAVFILMALVIVVPTLGLAGGMADMFRSKPKVSAALIYSILALLLLLLAVLVGALHVINPVGVLGTSWEMGHTKLVLGVAILGGLGALHYWGGKIWGKEPSEALGRLVPLVVAAGVVMWAVPELISGLQGQVALGDRSGLVEEVDGAAAMNGIAAVGGLVVLGGVALALLNTLPAMLRKRTVDAPADPYGGLTLEWAATSPPPHGNFTDPLPAVYSASPLFDARESAGDAGDNEVAEEGDRA